MQLNSQTYIQFHLETIHFLQIINIKLCEIRYFVSLYHDYLPGTRVRAAFNF